MVRAKPPLRDGKIAEAQALLDEVARTIPDPAFTEAEEATYSSWGESGKLNTPSLAHGEDGALLLTQGRPTQALDHFLRGGFWLEAGYVADRLLTVDELKAYVDATWPAGMALAIRPRRRATTSPPASRRRSPGSWPTTSAISSAGGWCATAVSPKPRPTSPAICTRCTRR